jgi:putative transferase (TIGR04331 family)
MLLVLNSDVILNSSVEDELLCLSVETKNKLECKGYKNVKLINLPEKEKENLQNYEKDFHLKVNRFSEYCRNILEGYHSVGFNQKSWGYIIGLWSYHFLCVCSDRYSRLLHVKECYPGIKIAGLEVKDKATLVPSSLENFIEMLKAERYNAIIYTDIAKILCLNVQSTSVIYQGLHVEDSNARKLIAETAKKFMYKLFLRRAKIVLQNPYLPKNILFKLFVFSRGRILPLPKYKAELKSNKTNLDKRYRLFSEPFEGDECNLSLIINKLAPLMFPKSTLENFKNLLQRIEIYNGKHIQAIFTSAGWYYDEQFKFLAAVFHKNGRMVVSAPHGGGQFVRRFYHVKYYELALVDCYYASGVMPAVNCENAVALPAPKYFYVKNYFHKYMKKNKQSFLLYGLTSSPAYTADFDFFPEDFSSYMKFIKRFLEALSPTFHNRLTVRAHREDMGWGVHDYTRQISAKIKFDDWRNSFYQSLSASRLYICDHVSTTYAEALMANQPILMFFDRREMRITAEAIPFFERFKDVGVFHDTPESAAAYVEKIYDHVDDWWFSTKVQECRKLFCDNFALTSKHASKDWLVKLKSVYTKTSADE